MKYFIMLAAGFAASMLVAGAALSQPAEKLSYRTWSDPTERAFTIHVPKGWQVQGGIHRRYLRMLCEKVHVRSADGAVEAYIGNDFPAFQDVSGIMDLPEGMPLPVTAPEKQPVIVMSHRSGVAFGTDLYLPHRQKDARWESYRVTSRRDRPEVARALAGDALGRLDAGEVEYTFRRGGRDGVGYALCVTEHGVAGFWRVFRVFSHEASLGREEEGRQALARMTASLWFDTDWLLRLAILRGKQISIDAASQNEMRELISKSYWARQEVLDRVFRAAAHARRGTVDLFDPQTGQTLYGEQGGADYYWIDPRGQIVRTATHLPPGLAFRPLRVLP